MCVLINRHNVGPGRTTVLNRNQGLSMLIPHVKPGHYCFQVQYYYSIVVTKAATERAI